ncbi:TSUP family transporter [Polyangium fumosum]|uniref:Probable membrane transporter protein n=1 Tax=Polyangium fumosum TaxID=889272 RepID=A0A4U1IXG1_9BACT|nr:TSUP family transporter [Polyangium fumosum]TKC98748.1 sulfite exporter TauE/SafE family protein [Polyangium fumosum]
MLVLAAPLALVIGLSLGLLGGGGSILTLPVLVYVLGVEPRSAIAMSLFTVAITSAAAAFAHARKGRVSYRTGAVFGGAGMAGAFGGGFVAHAIPASLLMLVFALIMLATAVAMLRGRHEPARTQTAPLWKILVLGALVGVVAGLVGAGGGFLIVPALVLLGGLAMPEAIGTSLFVIALQSAAGFAAHLGHQTVDWTLTLLIAGLSVGASLAGARLAHRLSGDALRRGFAWFVLAMAIVLLFEHVPDSLRPALLGGSLIGLAASILMLFHGRIAGVSGILGGVLSPKAGDVAWRVGFLLGMVAGGAALRALRPAAFPAAASGPLWLLAIAGLLVGYGTRLANGCTSGHGVCGISRLSARSLVATATFMFFAFVTVFVSTRILGGIR